VVQEHLTKMAQLVVAAEEVLVLGEETHLLALEALEAVVLQ
jgi:hypothetical protein